MEINDLEDTVTKIKTFHINYYRYLREIYL